MDLKLKNKIKNLSNIFEISAFLIKKNADINLYCVSIYAFLSNTYYFFFSNKSYYTGINTGSIVQISYFLFLNRMMQLKLFSELAVSDFPNYKYRLLYVYIIVSIIFNKRYMLQIISNKFFVIHSITNIFPSAS